MKLTREELRHNFLKSIIVRLDFKGVFKSEIDKVIIEIKEYLFLNKFNRYEEKNTNQMNITLNNLDEENNDIKQQVTQNIIYSFINEDEGLNIDISNEFICININSVNYIAFERYIEYMKHIIEEFNKKVKYFTPTRFGLRKINQCAIYSDAKINDYFKQEYYKFSSVLGNNKIKVSNNYQILQYDEFKINIASIIQRGKKEDKDVNVITLDTDIYLDNNLKNAEEIDYEKMNNALFDIFCSVLTNNFLQKLKSKSFEDNNIDGVEENE